MTSPFPSESRSAQRAMVSTTSQPLTCSERPTVSIVDDDPHIRAMVADELTDSGCFVLSLQNCLALDEVLADGGVDLVFLDVQMPGCDGIECLRDLRSRGFTMPVVIFTSLNEPERRRQAQEAGANDYVLKHELLDRLPGLLQRLLPQRLENPCL
ncbi:response regulator transcription factor [Synechococcus sp. CCY 9618]|uniref:response regulator transcription factor n=1 Tax=Synechococcus sp. CCY 9618 TaxID=2815602 RepID=UPI001C21252C|nr:response regulator [Synechococcus sp. CCY 9618]